MIEHLRDSQLVQRLLAGDEREFARFFGEQYPRLYRFAFARLGGDADAADEMAQRTLCRAVRKLHLYRAEASLFTWLCQICRHEIHDYVAMQERQGQHVVSFNDDSAVRATLESLSAEDHSDPDNATRRIEILQSVQRVLDHLPTHYADVLEWKYIEEIGVTDIAGRLSVTVHAAESLLARARRAFRDGWLSVTGERLPELAAMEGTR